MHPCQKIGIEFEARILSSTDDSHSESKAALQLRASTSSQGTDEARMAGQKTWVLSPRQPIYRSLLEKLRDVSCQKAAAAGNLWAEASCILHSYIIIYVYQLATTISALLSLINWNELVEAAKPSVLPDGIPWALVHPDSNCRRPFQGKDGRVWCSCPCGSISAAVGLDV